MRGVPMITATPHDAAGAAGCHVRPTMRTIAAAAASAGARNRTPMYAFCVLVVSGFSRT